MKVIAFGSCMSALTISWLKEDYGFEMTHSVHHNRSDNFIRYFIDRESEIIPRSYFDDLLIYKPEFEQEGRFFLLNQYADYVGYHELHEKKTALDQNLFDDLKEMKIDVILMDNFMDIAAKLMFIKNEPKYKNSPIFINGHFYQNETEVMSRFDWWGDYLKPEQSASNFLQIYRWLRKLQPEAKIFFLPYHSCSSLTVPARFRRAHDFYPALLKEAKNEDLHIVPPLEVAPQHTKGEVDWPHFQMPLYRAMAGHIYLNIISRSPSPLTFRNASAGNVLPEKSAVTITENMNEKPINHMFDAIISLGEQCKTAYQLRKFTGSNVSGVFDWLVTPQEALLYLIQTDFSDFFRLENLAVRPDGNGVEDRASGVIFQHAFQRDADGKNTQVSVDEGFARERGKINHLLKKWRALDTLERVLFVRSGEYEAGFTEKLYSCLSARFPTLEIYLLMVSESHPIAEVISDKILERIVTDDAGNFPDLWKGRDSGWHEVLSGILCAEPPRRNFQMAYFE